MRLSKSLQKNIIETTVGGLLNKFKIMSRRPTLFFEDILANYVAECEKQGYDEESEEIGRRWASLTTQELVPTVFKKLPTSIFFNKIMKKIWINVGFLEDFHIIKQNNIIIIKTKNEITTRLIGPNKAVIGVYIGILNTIFNSQIEYIEALQTKKLCKYVFKLKKEHFGKIKAKDRKTYNKLNYLPQTKGFTLKDALKANIVQLDEYNKLFFRGKHLSPRENTLFHLISNKGILFEKIPYLSFDYFKNIIIKESSNDEKLILLKTLLEITGWGKIKIISKPKEILLEIRNPPHGLQPEKDNWNFLTRVILGYLWLLNDFRITNIEESYKNLKILYSI